MRGSAVSGGTVELFTQAGCAGGVAASGTSAQFAAGIEVSVPADQATSISARVTRLGVASGCSSTLTYTHQTPKTQTPPTAKTPVASTASWVTSSSRVWEPATRVRFRYTYAGTQPIVITLYRRADRGEPGAFIRQAWRTPAGDGTYGWSTITPRAGSYIARIRTDDGRLLATLPVTVR